MANEANQEPSDLPSEPQMEIRQVLERAISDPDFKNQLLDDPDTALEGYNLTEVQTLLIKSMDESDLEKLTPENLSEYFSVDAAVYTPEDADQIQGYKTYQPEDLDLLT